MHPGIKDKQICRAINHFNLFISQEEIFFSNYAGELCVTSLRAEEK
jgi:hypothetical protein